jgi:hypothetical protein
MRWAGAALHAATLLATAWLLVATSAPDIPLVPARDCFTGIPSPAALLVTLGGPAPDEGGVDPNCAGIDGLASGVALLFDVVHGERPKVQGADACFGFQTTGLEGVSGVVLGVTAPPSDGSLTTVQGLFMPASQQGCLGRWSLDLKPVAPVPDRGLVSPLDAGAGSWLVVRTIDLPQAQFCALSAGGPLICKDTFVVQSITISGDP